MGIKTEGRWREGALRNHQSPSWGSSLFGFIFYLFFIKKHSTQRGRGAGREGENEGKMEGGKSMGKEEEGKAGGGGGTSEGMKKKALCVILSIGFNAHFLFVSRPVDAKGGNLGAVNIS